MFTHYHPDDTLVQRLQEYFEQNPFRPYVPTGNIVPAVILTRGEVFASLVDLSLGNVCDGQLGDLIDQYTSLHEAALKALTVPNYRKVVALRDAMLRVVTANAMPSGERLESDDSDEHYGLTIMSNGKVSAGFVAALVKFIRDNRPDPKVVDEQFAEDFQRWYDAAVEAAYIETLPGLLQTLVEAMKRAKTERETTNALRDLQREQQRMKLTHERELREAAITAAVSMAQALGLRVTDESMARFIAQFPDAEMQATILARINDTVPEAAPADEPDWMDALRADPDEAKIEGIIMGLKAMGAQTFADCETLLREQYPDMVDKIAAMWPAPEATAEVSTEERHEEGEPVAATTE